MTARSTPLQLKKVLSSIPESVLNVESLTNDVDVRGNMTREVFEQRAQPVLDRVKLPLQQVVCVHSHYPYLVECVQWQDPLAYDVLCKHGHICIQSIWALLCLALLRDDGSAWQT